MVEPDTRVALLHGAAPAQLDGVSDYVERLAAALPETGVQPVVVPVPRGRGTGWWSTLDRVAGRVAATRPDVVHVQFSDSGYGFSRVPGLLLPHVLRRWIPPHRVPVVTTLHEYGEPPGPGRLVPASRAVIVTNDAHGRLLYRRTGRHALRIPLAPNVERVPVAPDVRRRVRARLGLAPDAPLLAFFGFVHPVKGVRYAIEALPALRARFPGAHLLVLGGFTSLALPPAQARAFEVELAALAGRLGLTGAVTFTGYRPAAEASELLSAADVAVLPFTAGVTPKSGALLTVLAHRLPTVVTVPDRSPPELVDGQTVICAAGRRDAGALVEAVGRVLRDPALAARIAAAGAGLAAPRSWARVAQSHRDLYATLLPHALPVPSYV